MISGKGGYAADLFFALKRKKALAVKAFLGKIYGYRLSLSLIKTAAGKKHRLFSDRKSRKQVIVLDSVFQIIVA